MKPVIVVSFVFLVVGQFAFSEVYAKRSKNDSDEVRVFPMKRQRSSKKCNKILCNEGRSSLNFDKKCLKAQFCMRGVVKDAKKMKKEKDECLKKRKHVGGKEMEEEKVVNNESLQTKYNELKKNYDSIISNQQTLELSLGILKAENVQLKLVQGKMTEENAELKLKQGSITKENKELKRKQGKLAQESKELKITNQNLMKKAENVNTTGLALTSVETKLENCFKSKLKLTEDCSNKNFELSENLKEAILNLDKTKDELNDQKAKYKTLANSNKDITNKHSHLEAQNQEIKSKSNELTKKHTEIVSNFGICQLQLSMCVEEKEKEENLTQDQLTSCQTESFRLIQQNEQLSQNNTDCSERMNELSLCREETGRLAMLVENRLSQAKARKEETESYVTQNSLEPIIETNDGQIVFKDEYESSTENDVTSQLKECQQEVIEKDLSLKKEMSKVCKEEDSKLGKDNVKVKESQMLSLEMKNQMLTYEIKNLTMSLSECNQEMATMLVIPSVKEEISDFLVNDLLN